MSQIFQVSDKSRELIEGEPYLFSAFNLLAFLAQAMLKTFRKLRDRM